MGKGIDDGDVVMIRYKHPNRGQHQVRGSATRRDYGYRGGGEMFLVEHADAVAAPHLFEIVERPVAKHIPEKKPDLQPPPDLLEVAVAKGVLEKSGAHLMLNGKSIGQGKEKSREALLSSPELRGAIELATFGALPAQVQRLEQVA